MKLRFVDSTLHGVLDYVAAAALIVLPFVLGLTGSALWLSVAGGAALVGYSLMTDYRFGVGGALSFDAHLALDLVTGVGFTLTPFVLKFEDVAALYYIVMGGGVMLVVLTSERVAHDEETT
jgi:hypothetical protein